MTTQFIEGKCQKAIFFQGTLVICPIHSDHFFCWDSTLQMIALNLKPKLLSLSAIELLGKDYVELIPKFGFQDGLIHQIALAMQTERRC